MGEGAKLIETGVHKLFTAKQEKLLAEQEAYRIRDMKYQGDQIVEKEELLASIKQYKIIILGIGLVLILALCMNVYSLIQRSKRKKLKQQELRRMENTLRKFNIPF